MASKFRIFFIAAIFTLLLSLLTSGCGSDSGTSQSGGAGTSSLSPDSVAMVNGKEIAKSELAGAVNYDQISSSEERLARGRPGEMPKPGTAEYASLETSEVEQLVYIEIEGFEADKMGLVVTEDEVNSEMDKWIQQAGGQAAFDQALKTSNSTYDQNRSNMRLQLIQNKLFQEVTKDVAAGSNQTETANIKKKYFQDYLLGARSSYDVIYADQYKPASTAAKTTN